MIRDPQRQRVYALEAEAFRPAPATLKHLTKIARRVFARYRVKPIPVYAEWMTADRYAHYEDETPRCIVLNARANYSGLSVPTLIHELAHYILHCYEGDVSHGPAFVSLFRDLCSQYKLLTYAEFDALAAKHKVKR